MPEPVAMKSWGLLAGGAALALLALPALALGVGCALPFYLFLRSARIA